MHAYMYRQIESVLVQMMVYRMYGAKPVLKPKQKCHPGFSILYIQYVEISTLSDGHFIQIFPLRNLIKRKMFTLRYIP